MNKAKGLRIKPQSFCFVNDLNPSLDGEGLERGEK